MNRIEAKLAELKEKNEKAFITYITAGLPDLEVTKQVVFGQERAGTDILELGVPFSDPVADGPVIQAASFEAIQNGTNIHNVFQMVRELREEGLKLPLVFMLYYNTVLHYGVTEFIEQCRLSGVDGLIIPDLPFEEQDEIKKALGESDSTILIQLVSPVSGGRISKILSEARGFVYCVSSMGVTGQSAEFHKEVMGYLEHVKNSSKIPVMMGFGIRTPEDIEPMKGLIHGVIVGSHFIQIFRDSGYDVTVTEDYSRTFKSKLKEL
ncbi:MAG: tryptophan synthase subunit alpha [Lachnospiraceae bacterium]